MEQAAKSQTEWSFDMEAAEDRAQGSREVIVAFVVGTDWVRVPCVRRQFKSGTEANVTVEDWVSAFNGERVNGLWRAYAWCESPIPPDPAEAPR